MFLYKAEEEDCPVFSWRLCFICFRRPMYLLGSMAGRRGSHGRNLFIPSAALFALFAMSLLDAAACGGCGDARKLLQMNAVCSKNDVAIYQGPTEPLPSGIPAFTVQIMNVCASNCYIMNIHVNCGWFSSVHLVNPQVFRRVDYDDCVVNNGEALGPGQSLSFQYANSFQYPLSVSSVDCS